MPVEQRGQVIAVEHGPTGSNREEPEGSARRRQPWCDDTSRMMREYHVRICEGLGVKFPGSTRQSRSSGDVWLTSAFRCNGDKGQTTRRALSHVLVFSTSNGFKPTSSYPPPLSSGHDTAVIKAGRLDRREYHSFTFGRRLRDQN